MPIISIIIPCFNAESWIRRCADSLIKQTFTDYEAIFIDDGSTDNTLLLLHELQAVDSRFKVITKSNGGVSSARNVGMDMAKGEWITFVDVDDTLSADGLKTMFQLISDDLDVVFAGYCIIGTKSPFRQPDEKSVVCSNLILAKELFAPSDYPYLGYPWAKLFRRSVINNNNLRFNEDIKYNEDRLFTFSFLAHVSRGAYTTNPVYEYNLHDGNAMSAIEGPNYWKFETDLDAFIEMSKIALRYDSAELLRLVRIGTIASYNWNLRLNIKYGGNSTDTKTRLKNKLYSVVPSSLIWKYRISTLISALFSKIKRTLQ